MRNKMLNIEEKKYLKCTDICVGQTALSDFRTDFSNLIKIKIFF